eukprot:403368673
MGQLTTIAYLFTIFGSIFVFSYILWRIIWFRNYGVEIPIDRNFNIQAINQRKLFYKTKTYHIFVNFISNIIKKLDMDYWITHTGTDGYLYLLFQRRFLKLLLYFSAISILISIPINITSGVGDQTYEDWFERTTLNNKELSNFKGWIHVILVLIFTLLTIRAVQKTRRDARIAYQFYHREMSKNHDHEWLNARTVHVKGIPPEDRSGNILRASLERVIAPTGGQVLGVILLPDFVNQLVIEGKIKDIKDLQMLIDASGEGKDQYFNCCIPQRYKDPQAFQRKLDKLEQKLNEETMKPFKPSGHAFVCFDSIKSVNEVINSFRLGPSQYAKLLCLQIRDKLQAVLHQPQRDRVQSTFIKFEEMDAQVQMQGAGDQVLIMNLASDPIDILWRNIGGTSRGVFIFRRLFLHLIGILIVLFISTPTAMLSTLRQVDIFGIFDFTWADNLPQGSFLKSHLPPLVILGINQILLLLIDLTSLVEKHETHSLYQIAIYTKSVIYLNLNMLVIPALTLTTSEPFINIIFSKKFDLTQILGNFYIANSGIFFVSILIQQACLSSSFYLLNAPDIFLSYFSPWLALEKRKIFNDAEAWRRKESFCFQYGFFYAQMMTVFAIALVFSSTVPLVTLAAAFFFGLRHYVDSLNLLTYFRKEIDSNGKLISTVTNSALMFVILYQLSMMAFFTIKKRDAEAMVVCFIFVISIMFAAISYEEVYDLSKIEAEGVDKNEQVFNEEAFSKWRSEYEHPLVIGNVRRKARTLGVEIKTVNDWEQFIGDENIQGMLFSVSGERYRKSGFFQMSDDLKGRGDGGDRVNANANIQIENS